MKSVYIETTVASYYVARPSRDLIIAARQESSRQLWPKLLSDYECHVSALVRQEAGRGEQEQSTLRLQAISGFPILDIDDEARQLAAGIVNGHGIPEEYPEDALHIGVATVNGIDVIVTWNFTHLNNPSTKMKVRQLVEDAGYRCPEICSPDELLEDVP